MMIRAACIALLTACALAAPLLAEPEAITIPQMLSYQGKLTDTLGVPVPDTVHAVRFRLYTVPSGGSHFWEENQQVRTANGLFSVLLGSVTAIGSMPDAGSAWLGMAVAGGVELSPRLRLASSAYAYLAARAAGADLLQGKDTAALDARFVNESQANSVTGAMLVDATVGAADLNQMGATANQVLKWTGATWSPRNDSVGGGTPDNAWARSVPADSVLYTMRKLGVARGNAGNLLLGAYRCTHTNLGVACTTGTAAQNEDGCAVLGGWANKAAGTFTAVGGGRENKATAYAAAIGGGYANTAGGTYYSTVAGGRGNSATGHSATVGGGSNDSAGGAAATIAGGSDNRAAGDASSIGGGTANRAAGAYSTVPGGTENVARGCGSFAAGMRAKASHDGCFVFNDSSDAPDDSMWSTADNQFRIRARGGAWFYSNQGRSLGVRLPSGSNAWEVACDSANKEGFRPVDRRELLERVAALNVREYRLKGQPGDARHIGPVAQDFHSRLGYGESETGINTADADGVLFAAVQALYEDNLALRDELAALRAELNLPPR